MPSLPWVYVISSSKIAGEAREADLSASDLNSTWEDDGLSSVDVVIFYSLISNLLFSPSSPQGLMCPSWPHTGGGPASTSLVLGHSPLS